MAGRPKSLRALWKPDQETALSWTIALGFRALDHDPPSPSAFAKATADKKLRRADAMGRLRLSPVDPHRSSFAEDFGGKGPACAAGTAPGFRPWTTTKAGGLGCALVKENGRQRQ